MTTPNYTAMPFADTTPGAVLRCPIDSNGKAETRLVIIAKNDNGKPAVVAMRLTPSGYPGYVCPAQWNMPVLRIDGVIVFQVLPNSPVLLRKPEEELCRNSLILVESQWFLQAEAQNEKSFDCMYLDLQTYELIAALPPGTKAAFPEWSIRTASGFELYTSTPT
jgi:hypothetical protein